MTARKDWATDIEIKEDGPFDWKLFFEDIKFDTGGLMTFTIVSTGEGTVYLREISLVKIE